MCSVAQTHLVYLAPVIKSSAPLQSFKQDLLDPGKAWRGDSGHSQSSPWISGFSGRRKRPLLAARAAKEPSPSHSPSSRKRKPMRRPARSPQWRSSSAPLPGWDPRKVIFSFLLVWLNKQQTRSRKRWTQSDFYISKPKRILVQI